jgi:glycosyltransferase involved in cell wall biosynthesis
MKFNMKILQVIPFFTPVMGGSVISTYNLSKQLAKRGHDVTIFTTDYELDENYIRSLDGIHVVSFHCKANIGMMLFSPEMNRKCRKEIKNFDIIHMNNFRSYQNIVACRYAKKYSIPYVLQPRGDIPRTNVKRRIKKFFDLLYGYKISNGASKIIFSSNFELKETERDFVICKDKVEFIPNGTDLLEHDLPEKGNFRRKYSIKDRDKIILFLGRIHEIKGVDLLARSFSKLSMILDDTTLVFVGPDDGYLSSLKDLVKQLGIVDNVTFTNSLFGVEKLQAYVDSDVVVIPSRYESFGNTALEACACGTPVIVTCNCGVKEWISSDVGRVVDFDEDQLANAIFEIVNNEKLKEKLGANGSKLMKDMFSWDNIARKTEEFYETIIAKEL